MNKLKTIILAAGEGKRMNSNISKVMHKVMDTPMIDYVIDVAEKVNSEKIILVVGHNKEQVEKNIHKKIEFVTQKEQLGTGHAVMMAEDFIDDNGDILILYGDTPLIEESTILDVIKRHREHNNDATVVSTIVENPKGYGRIIKKTGLIHRIVEERDTNDDEKKINEINTGIYCFKAKSLKASLNKLSSDNAQNEYYITDTIEILIKDGLKAEAYVADDENEFLGVNDRIQLEEVTKIMQNRVNTKHQINGVTFIDKNNSYISKFVTIGKDTIIEPNVMIEGHSDIGENCVIGSGTKIVNSIIKANVNVQNSQILNSFIDMDTIVGPFAYVRPNSSVGKNCKIGDFVEIKNANIGDDTKISHLAYIGDSDVGKNVNIGCGVITVNYTGKNKYRTIIEDDCFIGCNTNLVAPVTLRKSAYIAAGSTITEEVPKNALAIARSRQIIKENWTNKD